ncbi:MAG TPA: hypothetical protein VNO30_07035 [Kofleriaceae bacterium]|nr:hypothetical protein [Kofleriaceae bacterium]
MKLRTLQPPRLRSFSLLPSFLALLLPLLLPQALAGCASPAGPSTQPPMVSETPPMTKDPGAVRDEKPLQPAPPVKPGGQGHDHGSSGDGNTGGQAVGRPAGASCIVGPECASGVCEGEGCTSDRPGTCAPTTRPCTRDLRQYCGCDGKTFGASGTCPGRRFASRAPCGS